MSANPYAVIIVYSTSHAIRIEKLLGDQDITNKLIPVPRQISSDCGVCVRIARDDVPVAQAAIDAAQIDIQGIHEI
jgi:hypothetical protein